MTEPVHDLSRLRIDRDRPSASSSWALLNTITCLGMPDSYRVGWFSLGERGTWAQGRGMHQRFIDPTAGEPVG
jgi:hypothetical protein